MVVVIEWQVVIDDKFYEMGPRSTQNHTAMQYIRSDNGDFSHHAMQKWASPCLSLVALCIVNPLYWYSQKKWDSPRNLNK